MNGGNVLAVFAEPERDSTLRAVSLALLRIRASGVSWVDLGKLLHRFPGHVAPFAAGKTNIY